MKQYINEISKIENPTFQDIRDKAVNSISHLSKAEHDELYAKLKHGVPLLGSHELMCKYLSSFGNMHEEKIHVSLNGLNNNSLLSGEYDIIDWGCGQGIATICFFDFIKQNGLDVTINNIILIEPSPMALERAELHIKAYQKDSSKIRKVQKFLNGVTESDIETDGFRPVIHFFSNILDIKEIDLKGISVRLDKSVLNDSYIITVGPINGREHRIDHFYGFFNVPIIFEAHEPQHFYGSNQKCTLKVKVYKLEANNESNLIPIEFYPSVQFHAAYELDSVKEKRKQIDSTEDIIILEIIDCLTRFETSTPFDIGASVYDDIHSILAVLNNIVTRGLPTKASPFIEQEFEKFFGYSTPINTRGEISFSLQKDIAYKETLIWINNVINSSNSIDFKDIDLIQLQLLLSPIAIARIQKTILEAIMTNQLDMNLATWKVLVQEQDVPCAAIAFKDLEQVFDNLTQLSTEYQNLKFPKVNLEIISTAEFCNSPLHLNTKVNAKALPVQSKTIYDLVIDIAVLEKSNINKDSFSQFNCKNDSYFNIRSAVQKRSVRNIYTSNLIQYRDLVTKDIQGKYIEITETKELLQYFMQLIFRKEEFRPGQLPILNRALQNKSVIGLLPTGGGKSLTYQLAAMLQPGVTIVIDPLRSLMKDQYDGLINSGIDTCTFINSTQSSQDKKQRESQMESSQMQFVLMSPERLCIYKFRERLKTMRDMNVYFAYGVIDEVHCVSEWGHDFRFSYLHLGRNLYNYVCPKDQEKHLTLFGLTATASFDVLADVERELSGNGAFPLDSETIIRYENTNRLELQYKVHKIDAKINPWAKDPKWDVFKSKNQEISKFVLKIPELITDLQTPESILSIKNNFIERDKLDSKVNKLEIDRINQSDLTIEVPANWFNQNLVYDNAGIVFCPHRKGSLGIDNTHANRGVANAISTDLQCSFVGTFKGGDDMRDQQRFIENKIPIMVATKAFGMGIDKPNVRFTVNVNMTSSLEGFVQEAGRAGRDKRMALATILYSDYQDVDKDVQMFFFDNNFKGKDFEKKVMNTLLSHNSTDVFLGNDAEHKPNFETIENFLEKYLAAEINTEIVAFIKFPQQKNDNSNFDFVYWKNNEVKLLKERGNIATIEVDGTENDVNKQDLIFKSDISKAIYRMTSIELIFDFTEDYSNNQYRIVTKRRDIGSFYLSLKSFLERYYSADRAEQELQKVKDFILPLPTSSTLQKELYQCLNYLTEFIYEKIAVKRKRAIDDMKAFCVQGLNNTKDWKEVNEDLKDYIYYYFNSKYAKDDYIANNGEEFSLTKDTNYGKGKDAQFIPDIIFKYMRVINIDDPMFGPGETPKDNIKHLQGAVRLIRRSLTEINPILNLLNSFCLMSLGTNHNDVLVVELQDSYIEGMVELENQLNNSIDFWDTFDKYNEALESFSDTVQLLKLKQEVILKIHSIKLKNITDKYLQ